MIIIPKVCAWCHSIKYIEKPKDMLEPPLEKWVPMSHTICPKCLEKELKKIENILDN